MFEDGFELSGSVRRMSCSYSSNHRLGGALSWESISEVHKFRPRRGSIEEVLDAYFPSSAKQHCFAG